MTVKRPGAYLFSHIVIFLFGLTLLSPPVLLSAVTPDREIVPLDTSSELPKWKQYWDAGRKLVREGKYSEAAFYYKELITRKPQIEEARWEYCKILFKLEEYTDASAYLESLIELDPYRNDYLAMAGKVALRLEDYAQAASYLGQVYSQQPEGREGIMLLAGLIEALMAQGKKSYAFPLMEQLNVRNPGDQELLQDLARYANELGHHAKAKEYYTELTTTFTVTSDVLIEAAEMYHSSGNIAGAVAIWQEVLTRDPHYLPFHKNLYRYHTSIDEPRQALKHILAIIDKDSEFDPDLLLKAGRIYLQEFNRADKALYYYDRYLKRFPDNTKVRGERDKVRAKIADDLLAIVVNDGAKLLYADLQKLTADSLSIYSLMAEKLEKANKYRPLAKVLEVILEHTAEKDPKRLQLVTVYSRLGKFSKAYEQLVQVKEDRYKDLQYFQKKAQLEQSFGLQAKALESYRKALSIAPDNSAIRKKAIALAGGLGLLDRLAVLARPLMDNGLAAADYDTVLVLLENLRLNGQYRKVLQTYDRLGQQPWISAEQRQQLTLHKADTLHRQGLHYEAQQLAREALAGSPKSQEALIALIHFSLDTGSVKDARSLFSYLSTLKTPGQSSTLTTEGWDRFSLQISILIAENKIYTAIEELQDYLTTLRQRPANTDRQTLLGDAEKLLCSLYLKTRQKKQCNNLLPIAKPTANNDPQSRVMQQLIAGDGNIDGSQLAKTILQQKNSNGGEQNLLVAAIHAEKHGETKAALTLMDELLKLYPKSIHTQLRIAKTLHHSGMLQESAKIYARLVHAFPDEPYFNRMYLQLDFKQGNFAAALASLENSQQADASTEMQLYQARALWALDRRKEALDLYASMLQSSIIDEFYKQLAAKDISPEKRQELQAFGWLITSEETEILDQLLRLDSDDGFLSRLGSEEAHIAAGLYSRYRWQKRLKNEYFARKAVEDKRYIVAEKQYRRSLKEEQSTEDLLDLAKIYQRLGDYTKEAEVYSELQQQEENLPGLEKSIKRNELSRAPTLAGSYAGRHREGRDGAIDIIKQRAGARLWFMPQLSSEVELDYAELFYKPASTKRGSLQGREFSGRGTFELTESTTIHADMGFHMLDDEGDTLAVYDLRLEHDLDDLLGGYLVLGQNIVDDTTRSLLDSLKTQNTGFGVTLSGDTGINLGCEYNRLRYNDRNNKDVIRFSSGYSIFSEYTTFELTYNYEISNTDEVNVLTVDPFSGEVRNSLNYWSPGEYWQHLASLRIHRMLKDFSAFHKSPSNYLLDLSVGYETGGNYTYSGSFDIFLEMSSNLLVKGNLFFSRNNEYDDRSVAVSLMYRW